MYKLLRRDQSGAVAMITVIFIAILMTIMTASFIRLAINEQRESTDDDLTTRAFYAAESGVEDAIRAIKEEDIDKNTASNKVCEPAYGPTSGELSAVDGLDTEFTCQIIDMTPSEYEAYINENSSVFFPLIGNEDILSFELNWHTYGPNLLGYDGTTATARGTSDLPPTDAPHPTATWGDHPAMLRVQVIESPQNNVQRGDIENYVGFLNPASGGLNVRPLSAIDVPISPDRVLDVPCSYTDPANPGQGEYFCSLTVDSLKLPPPPGDASDYYLRITALYAPTHIQVVATGVSGTPVALEGAQAVIDVTGRANDVYRRVEARIDLGQTGLRPEYAILSAESICKNFVITNVDTGYTVNNNINGNAARSCDFTHIP